VKQRGLGLAAIAVLCLVATHSAAARRPNVILVVTDDQRWDEVAIMPAVVDMAATGVTFANAFVPTALCCPSRASILTGLYPHSHGVRLVGFPETFVGPDRETLAVWLRREGYRTGFFGKYMNGYWHQGPPYTAAWYIPPGWSTWLAFAREAHYFDYGLVDEAGIVSSHGNEPGDYSTDVLRARALAFMRDALAENMPFFALFAPFAPHDEPRDAFFPQAAPRHNGRYSDLVFVRPPNYMEPDVADKPRYLQALPIASEQAQLWADIRHRGHLAALAAVDEALAAMLALLDEFDQRRDTVVVFTSDNGYLNGEHRQYAKPSIYDEALRVPLIVSHPRRIRGGRVVSQVVCNVDIAPTLAEIAGVPSRPVDGRSLRPLLRQARAHWPERVPIELWQADGTTAIRGVRTRRWKYVEYPASGERELYDIAADPYELVSRGSHVAYAALARTLSRLTARLHAGQ
jgi:N-acetylglucosamine-6-sulfatase